MKDRIRFFFNRVRERLWVKPLVICLLSIFAAFVARMVDQLGLGRGVPDVGPHSVETILEIISSSMLTIAVFAVGAMIAAYTSAGNSATPRSFAVVVADDVSQNALSSFIGAFIFSIVAQLALMNGYYGKAGRFTLFLITITVFAIVILNFVRWVDRIARLGRMGTTIDKIEAVTEKALRRRRDSPVLGGVKAGEADLAPGGVAVYADAVGYVQRIDLLKIQTEAERQEVRVVLVALPGTFAMPGIPLAWVRRPGGDLVAAPDLDVEELRKGFVIGGDRTFDEDPRFGLIVLSEIASRALSPAVNDPGSAIDVIGTLVRMFSLWLSPRPEPEEPEVKYDRVVVEELGLRDMFDDAFHAIARDGAGIVEVGIRLRKSLRALAAMEERAGSHHADEMAAFALRHAELALKLPEELDSLKSV